MIERRVFDMVVIGKRENKRLIFSDQYFLSLQIRDDSVKNKPCQEREVSYPFYCQFNVEDELRVPLYSSNQKNWYFSELEAKLTTD
ncbi:MAG: hypothetical protein KJ583_02280 [Nanoarchaeota archaeon]|nr:hypothetical protein [Nanoarchaeota archaeon]MBU1269744.1 hypothetical protein [Nanoarchaeota archaeon]MBU1604122.1 hypothetical protein [Nanoarchaeota archaeon]MBU2443915.1 hypothetical protein [Nanoarchaeota archaeon]